MKKEDVKKYLGKFYILDNQEGFFNQINREITKAEYDKLLSFNKIIFEYKYYQRKFQEIQLNFDEYFEILEKRKKWLLGLKKQRKANEMDLMYVDVNRAFINLITSFKVFTEHVEKRLSKQYGKGSIEKTNFKKLTSKLYDHYFSYRLFVRLRDYSIHYDYPIQKFEFNNDNPNKEDILEPLFIKSTLIANKTFKSKFENDYAFNSRNEFFPVKPLMLEFQKCINEFLPKISLIEQDRFLEAAKLILEYVEVTKTKENISIGYLVIEEAKNRFAWSKDLLQDQIAKLIVN